MKQWYDGYTFRGEKSIYNPNSVMQAIHNDDFDSYWTQTSVAEGFANDLVTFRNRDDILTLLIHLGYLAYDEETQSVYIPTEEIRRGFAKTIREVKQDETIRCVKESNQLIYDTVQGNQACVF